MTINWKTTPPTVPRVFFERFVFRDFEDYGDGQTGSCFVPRSM